MATSISHPELSAPASWKKQVTWWILVLPVAMGIAIATRDRYLLDFTHVMSGVLWTGADLFLGFIVGPVMRRLSPPQRRAVIQSLVPRTLLYMPIVALTTSTAGWYLANWLGDLNPSSPNRLWIVGALVITTILTVQGLGFLLPNNIRILREIQSASPNVERVGRLNQTNMRIAGVQGILQVIIILVMAHLAIG